MNDLVPNGGQSTEISLPAQADMLVMFQTENGLDGLMNRIAVQSRAEAKDHSPAEEKGRKALKSIAYRVSQTLAEIDRQGLAATETLRAQVALANAGRNTAKTFLASLRDEIKAPALEWEAKEEARVSGLRERLAQLAAPLDVQQMASEHIEADIDRLEAISIATGWEEFQAEAAIAKDAALTALRTALRVAMTREEEARELAELRRQKEEAAAAEAARLEAEAAKERERQAELDRAAKLAQSADAARKYIADLGADTEKPFPVIIHLLEVELVSRVDALGEHAEAIHQLRLVTLENVRARAAVAEKARKDAEEFAAHKAAEKARQEEAERAERETREREARHQEELAAAEARAAEAAEAERKRLADQKAAEDEARAKREKDKKHRMRIMQEIGDALLPIPREDMAQALLDGRIPHVRVIL